jgi:tetratricopeptide (TPR) repeat protein
MLWPVLLLLFARPEDTPATLHQRALTLFQQHNYKEAIPLFEQAANAEKPGSPEFQESALLIGQSYFALNQAPQAIPWLERVNAVNEANYMLGYAYLQTHRLNDSRAAFARLFGVPPDSPQAHLLTAGMYLKKEFEDLAESEARQAVALDPKLPQAHFVLGEIAIYRGRLDEGLAQMTEEIALNPGFAMAWYRRGDAYTRQEKWDAAIPDLQRAIWLNPDFSGPFILLGRCYFKKGNYPNAEGILRRALLIDPQNYSATYMLGQTLMLEGKKDEGRAVLEKLKTLRQQP